MQNLIRSSKNASHAKPMVVHTVKVSYSKNNREHCRTHVHLLIKMVKCVNAAYNKKYAAPVFRLNYLCFTLRAGF